ncbi:MAG: hypothetical protein Q4G28_10995 [Neisseria sp.]|nr:hypothetical protein [Neisseria sp.]
MKLISNHGNQINIEAQLNELEMLRSSLVEVLYGLDISDCETRTGFSYEEFEILLSKIDKLLANIEEA